ncbi:pollen-specific leucine-rich repeat extensin-like protein 1 [Rosa sericea]
MRFMFCKIHCPPFICFCKPSPHIYTPGPLKLENTPPPNPNPNPHVPSSKPDASDQLPNDPIEIKEESLAENPKPAENSLKSNLRKPDSSDPAAPKDEMKKRVQWMDFVGKDLVEIREFECSELDDTDNEYENRRGCICVIL